MTAPARSPPPASSGLPLVPLVKPPQSNWYCVGLKSSAGFSQLITPPGPSGSPAPRPRPPPRAPGGLIEPDRRPASQVLDRGVAAGLADDQEPEVVIGILCRRPLLV